MTPELTSITKYIRKMTNSVYVDYNDEEMNCITFYRIDKDMKVYDTPMINYGYIADFFDTEDKYNMYNCCQWIKDKFKESIHSELILEKTYKFLTHPMIKEKNYGNKNYRELVNNLEKAISDIVKAGTK